MSHRKNVKKSTWLSRLENTHPFVMMLYVSMLGIGGVFFFLVLSFATSQISFKLSAYPKAFLVSTPLLLACSWALERAKHFFALEDLKSLFKMLLISTLFALAFMVSQFLGWGELQLYGIGFRGLAAGSYLYLISGLHLLHVLAGFIFLVYFLIQTRRRYNDSVKILIAITNPFEKTKLDLLALYWHFMDFLWIVLALFFLYFFI
ncbi:MAG: cytochrome C oxidase subunit III [Cytophagales bacterium]|nr:MAG: cytochrome C oxidase subunit III [Cytophagales bacterium]TAF62271.1 MAG: cytochrome C oxidase subunit III [Cytophagales bacterium]